MNNTLYGTTMDQPEHSSPLETTSAGGVEHRTDAPKDILVTLHGIRDNGDWQEVLADIYQSHNPNTQHELFKYGFFDIIKFVFPLSRRKQVKQFGERLQELIAAISSRTSAPYRLHFAAHSFGTHVVSHSLIQLPREMRQNVGNIVLMGSVLPSSFGVLTLAALGPASKVYNFCSVNDNVLLLNAALPLRSGLAGRIGFKGSFDGTFVTHRFFRFGHGGYFSDCGRGDESWLGRYCVPALLAKQLPIGTHQRPRYGDFLSELMGFAKWSVIALAALASAYAYGGITLRDALEAFDAEKELISSASSLSVADFRQVERLNRTRYHDIFPSFREHRKLMVRRLRERIANENDVVLLVRKDSDSDVAAVRQSDMSLVVSHYEGISILTHAGKVGEPLKYAKRNLDQARAERVGFTNVGNVYFIRNRELYLGGRPDVKGSWRAFALNYDREFDGKRIYPDFVVELSAGELLVYSRISPDQGVSAYIIREGAEPKKIQLPIPDSFQPNPYDGLPIQRNQISAASLPGQFKDFVVIADRDTVLFVGREGTSLLISNDVEDVSGFTSEEERESKALRKAEIEGGYRPANVYKGIHFCDGVECTTSAIAFPSLEQKRTPRRRLYQSRLNAYSQGHELFIEMSVVLSDSSVTVGDPTCFRVARLGEGRLRPLMTVEEQVVKCPENDAAREYLHSRDATDLKSGNEYLKSNADYFGLQANPRGFRKFKREHVLEVYRPQITSCAFIDGHHGSNSAVVYSFDSQFAIRCLGRFLVSNDWGLLATVSNRGVPLFLPSRVLFVTQKGEAVSVSDDSNTDGDETKDKLFEGVPAEGIWVTFATTNSASLTWIKGSHIFALRFQEKVEGKIETKLTQAPLDGKYENAGHFEVCGYGFWHRGKADKYSSRDEQNLVRPDLFEATRKVTLINRASSICGELGAPVFADYMGEGETKRIGRYTVDAELGTRERGSRARVRRNFEGDESGVADAMYKSASNWD